MNVDIFLFLNGLVGKSMFLNGLVYFCAEIVPILLCIGACAYFFWRIKSVKKGLLTVGVIVGSWIISELLKVLFMVQRPFVYFPDIYPLFTLGGYSFPSGHATVFAALAVFMIIEKAPSQGWFIVGALLVGFGRVAAGVHYPIDILVGYVIGVASVLISFFFVKKFHNTSLKRQDSGR